MTSTAPSTNGDAAHPNDSDNNPVYTVWHGYDVVLTDSCHPSETKMEDHEHKHNPPEDAGQLSRSPSWQWRRRGSGNDYGWLRQLDLRSDIPSIDEIRDWSFDVLGFEEDVLISVFIKMLEYYNLLEIFGLDRQTLGRYCKNVMDMHHKDCYYQQVDIEEKDQKVDGESKMGQDEHTAQMMLCEYHNWYHAVSCAHVSFLFLTLGGADAFLYPVELFCIIMGGLIHDLDHPGTNNDFEIKRSTSLAKLYDNDSVLERHSINMGLNMCVKNPQLDWLSAFRDEQDREYVKHFIAESVLATDPARHSDIMKEGLAFVEKGAQDYQSTPSSEPSSVSPTSSSLVYFDQNDPQHRLFIGKLILHAADISNPLHCSFEVASDWAIRVITEFSRQANKEKQLQLPVTDFMDGLDSQVKIAKVQIGFFEWMVKPLYHIIGVMFSDLKMLNDWGERNCARYQLVIDEGQKEDVQNEVKKDADAHEQDQDAEQRMSKKVTIRNEGISNSS